jgi:glutamyl-tRNA reductase
VEIRERLALSESEIRSVLARLKDGVVHEALVLSTCNRTELYALPANEQITSDYLIEFLLSARQIPHHESGQYKSYFERMTYCDAMTHLFAVIAGIDSQIVGDQQIFAQVKDAFRISTESEMGGGFLTKLAHAAFRVAKRVISETTLTTGAATISYAAVEFARKIYDDLKSRSILIIGAGETSELAAKHFAERNAGTLVVANRNVDHAREMLARVRPDGPSNYRAAALSELGDLLPAADIIVSATAAPGYVVTLPMMREAIERRETSTPLVLIDIAVPRDIDPEIAKLSNVFVKDIDDLRSIVDRNLERRKQEIPKAERIIKEELDRFLATLSKLEVGPTIKELREKFEAIRKEELERQRGKLDERSFEAIDEMSRRMMNRLLHSPMVSLKEPHGSTDDLLTRVEIVRQLFALDDNDDES